jgi:interferon-induced transmembrane protein
MARSVGRSVFVNDPVLRRGTWWQQQDDGTWLRWNDASSTWERSETPPPPPEGAELPPAPPMPGQGGFAPYSATPGQVPNYLVWAILVTLFCFLPTGIVAIVFASQVNTKLAAGDVAGAVEASNKAKMWTIISAVVGVVVLVIVIAASAGTSTNVTFD